MRFVGHVSLIVSLLATPGGCGSQAASLDASAPMHEGGSMDGHSNVDATNLDDAPGDGLLDASFEPPACDGEATRDREGRVALQWARVACTGEPCEAIVFGRVDVDNVAPEKNVTVVYRESPSAEWKEAPASFHSMIDPARERWSFETPPFLLAADARVELFVRFETSAGIFDDGTEEQPHCIAMGRRHNEERWIAFGDAELALMSAHRSGPNLEGRIRVRDADRATDVGVLATDDRWASMNRILAERDADDAATWRFSGALSRSEEDVELAAFATVDGVTRWDNFFGDNHHIRASTAPWVGRWDLTVDGALPYPSWLEVRDAIGLAPLRFVGRVGSLRRGWELARTGDVLRISLPAQYEPRATPLVFSLVRSAEGIAGSTDGDDGNPHDVWGRAAPELTRASPSFGGERNLLPGPGLAGWHPRGEPSASRWSLVGDVLVNQAVGADLISDERFEDFRLRFDVRLPVGGNSGVFLRGRYEIQIQNDGSMRSSALRTGAVYGWLAPAARAPLPAGSWHAVEITLIGRRVTVRIGETTVIENGEIPGITGGALDSDEAMAGPLMFQGDHTTVEFRNVRIATPLP